LAETFPFQDPDLPLERRLDDLIGRLTLEEKAAQLLHQAPAVPRLGVPAHNYWNECLHGVARAGIATVFPQAIGLAATFDAKRLRRIASVISDEARAKHHEFLRHGDRGFYKGLTFWSPNINIFRDPRWGRGHETYGECPYLTGRLGVAFCQGLQGDDPRYLKLVATPKHLAVHSGPEALRHGFDASVSDKDLYETYLPAFFECVTEGRAESVMTAYNRVNGEPCSGSPRLIAEILRGEWGFSGYVVSDCFAIQDFHEGHGVTKTWEESAALALKAGCDLNCGRAYGHLPAAVAQGLVAESELDVALRRVFRARFRLGMFDPPERVPYAAIPYEVNDSPEHAELALAAARDSLVLLKNEDALLPLSPQLSSIAVIGPNAHDVRALLGNYHGTPSRSVTPLEGIRALVSPSTKVWYSEGCKLMATEIDSVVPQANLSEALAMASRSEVVVLCLGLNADVEGEQGDAAGDRETLDLPIVQERLLEAVVALGKPTVLVLVSGSALGVEWAAEHVPAIVQCFYPGQAGGQALAEALFGHFSPAGRLPITFPRSVADLPSFTDYSMRGRTYRYLEAEPLFPFGFGLSYTSFEYSELELERERFTAGESVSVSVSVRNVGSMAGDEVVQLYVADLEASVSVPHHDLRGFERITLAPGESRRVTFRLTARDFSLIDARGRRVLEPGRFRLSVGGSQPDVRSRELTGKSPLSATVELLGEPVELPY
jgi:beta-glucosidase